MVALGRDQEKGDHERAKGWILRIPAGAGCFIRQENHHHVNIPDSVGSNAHVESHPTRAVYNLLSRSKSMCDTLNECELFV